MSRARINDFASYVRDVGDGDLHAALSEKLLEVVKAIEEAEATGQKPSATMTLKLTLSMESGCVKTVPAITTALPKRSLKTSLHFVTPEGNLTRDNPRQMDLGLREVPAAPPARSLA